MLETVKVESMGDKWTFLIGIIGGAFAGLIICILLYHVIYHYYKLLDENNLKKSKHKKTAYILVIIYLLSHGVTYIKLIKICTSLNRYLVILTEVDVRVFDSYALAHDFLFQFYNA